MLQGVVTGRKNRLNGRNQRPIEVVENQHVSLHTASLQSKTLSMQTAREREYPERILIGSIYNADNPVEFTSRLWTKSIPDGIWRRVDDISKQFTGAGWKNLPQELVDEILDYLLDDLDALKACSLTCKRLFGATRPLVHRRFVCSSSKLEGHKPIGRLRRDSGAFGRLIDADRSGILRYTQHLTIKAEDGTLNLWEYLPHLRSIAKLHTLTLSDFHHHIFDPPFDEHFGMLTNTLRHLDIRHAHGTGRQLLPKICQFPLLEDLTIISPAGGTVTDTEHLIPMAIPSPPLRGRLLVSQVRSRELFESLVALQGGLNFRSLEFHLCEHLEIIIATCSHIVTSISYLWLCGGFDSKSNTSIRVYVAI